MAWMGKITNAKKFNTYWNMHQNPTGFGYNDKVNKSNEFIISMIRLCRQ
jgi:hypothetical protein